MLQLANQIFLNHLKLMATKFGISPLNHWPGGKHFGKVQGSLNYTGGYEVNISEQVNQSVSTFSVLFQINIIASTFKRASATEILKVFVEKLAYLFTYASQLVKIISLLQ